MKAALWSGRRSAKKEESHSRAGVLDERILTAAAPPVSQAVATTEVRVNPTSPSRNYKSQPPNPSTAPATASAPLIPSPPPSLEGGESGVIDTFEMSPAPSAGVPCSVTT